MSPKEPKIRIITIIYWRADGFSEQKLPPLRLWTIPPLESKTRPPLTAPHSAPESSCIAPSLVQTLPLCLIIKLNTEHLHYFTPSPPANLSTERLQLSPPRNLSLSLSLALIAIKITELCSSRSFSVINYKLLNSIRNSLNFDLLCN